MGIRSKPQQAAPAADERAVEAFIGKGGGVSPKALKGGKISRHQLRLPDEITERIDAVRPKGLTAPSRHDWLLDAVTEKLEREEGQTLANAKAGRGGAP